MEVFRKKADVCQKFTATVGLEGNEKELVLL